MPPQKSLGCIIIIITVPSASPTSVTTSSETSSSITVQWGPVNCIDRNGDVTGYSVRYGVQGDGSTQTVSVSGGGITETTISGLQSSTTYTIEVAAVNGAGIGPFSHPITTTTNGIIGYTRYTCCFNNFLLHRYDWSFHYYYYLCDHLLDIGWWCVSHWLQSVLLEH